MNKFEESDDWVAPDFFNKLTRNQKYAIIHFLGVIAASDVHAHSKINKKEYYFINFYYKEFKVSVEKYLAYIAMGGKEQVIADLKSLSKLNMQGLVFATTELCNYSGSMNDDELLTIADWVDSLGMTMNEWNDFYNNFDEFNNRPSESFDEEDD
ncbi:MAG: hypothetical protein HXX14_08190 [Bacteroidetes bacterium]|nr:hypothetical protein [Bacteroidota bacterium]